MTGLFTHPSITPLTTLIPYWHAKDLLNEFHSGFASIYKRMPLSEIGMLPSLYVEPAYAGKDKSGQAVSLFIKSTVRNPFKQAGQFHAFIKSTFPVFLYMTSMSTNLIPGLEEIN
jgi:hypothetical protein